MSNSKKKYWSGWNKDAAIYFNVVPSTITLWLKVKEPSLDVIIKHNKLLDWITDKLISEYGVPEEEAKRIVDKDRVGFEKCLEE